MMMRLSIVNQISRTVFRIPSRTLAAPTNQGQKHRKGAAKPAYVPPVKKNFHSKVIINKAIKCSTVRLILDIPKTAAKPSSEISSDASLKPNSPSPIDPVPDVDDDVEVDDDEDDDDDEDEDDDDDKDDEDDDDEDDANEKAKTPEAAVPVHAAKNWKIMPLTEAIQYAQSLRLDVILVSSKTDPPICKLGVAQIVEKDMMDHAKGTKAKLKAQAVKEVVVGGLIEKHDLEHKIGKVFEFLNLGYRVKLTVNARGRDLKKDPNCLDETVLRVLALVDGKVSTLKPSKVTDNRREFLLNPMPKV